MASLFNNSLIFMTTRFSYLFKRWLDGSSTPDEEKELWGLSLEETNQESLRFEMEKAWNATEEKEGLPAFEEAGLLRKMNVDGRRGMLQLSNKWRWKNIAVAASIILVIGLTGSLFMLNKSDDKTKTASELPVKQLDVEAPETIRATITTADGSRIYLDSVGIGQLAVQGNMKLMKLANGQIAYETAGSGKALTEIKYNTVVNPRGSKVIKMTLSDGTNFWLNAGSSVTYPIAFIGSERKVTITGEAYFEVAHDAGKSFYVSKGEVSVQVLGTHFNVNAYNDEDAIRVTLLEGSVKVKSGLKDQRNEVVIKPGEQAVANTNSGIIIMKDVDVEQVLSWKNGWFEFENASPEAILRQASRWYDLEIRYLTNVTDKRFGGRISRDLPLSALMNLLEQNGMHLRLEGRVLTVIP